MTKTLFLPPIDLEDREYPGRWKEKTFKAIIILTIMLEEPKIILDIGAGDMPWPYFYTGFTVVFTDECGFRIHDGKSVEIDDVQPILREQTEKVKKDATIANIQLVQNLEDRTTETGAYISWIKPDEWSGFRKLQPDEVYVAVDSLYCKNWVNEKISFRNSAFYDEARPVNVTGESLMRSLEKRYPGQCYFSDPGILQFIRTNSIDELHLHWFLSAYNSEDGKRNSEDMNTVQTILQQYSSLLKTSGKAVITDTNDLLKEKDVDRIMKGYGFEIYQKGSLKESLMYTLNPISKTDNTSWFREYRR